MIETPETPETPDTATSPAPALAPKALRELDAALRRRGPSADSRERVREALQRQALAEPFRARLRWWPALTFAAGATAMAVALLWMNAGDPNPSSTSPDERASRAQDRSAQDRSAQAHPDPHPESPSPAPPPACAPLSDGLLALGSGQCAAGDGVSLTALSPSTVEARGGELSLVAGALSFDVSPRPGRPLHVRVGAADIEVVGTRFTIHRSDSQEARPGTGTIAMTQGRVRVAVAGAKFVELAAGETLEWALEPSPAGPASKPSGTSPSSPGSPGHADVAALLADVATLRSQGAYEPAAQLLRDAATLPWSPRALESVSYELGTLLERQLHDPKGACAHWRAHLLRYPDGRHGPRIERSMIRIQCPPSAP